MCYVVAYSFVKLCCHFSMNVDVIEKNSNTFKRGIWMCHVVAYSFVKLCCHFSMNVDVIEKN
jgi:hypothetical protein